MDSWPLNWEAVVLTVPTNTQISFIHFRCCLSCSGSWANKEIIHVKNILLLTKTSSYISFVLCFLINQLPNLLASVHLFCNASTIQKHFDAPRSILHIPCRFVNIFCPAASTLKVAFHNVLFVSFGLFGSLNFAHGPPASTYCWQFVKWTRKIAPG